MQVCTQRACPRLSRDTPWNPLSGVFAEKWQVLEFFSLGVFSCTAVFFLRSHPQRESLSSLDWAFWAYTYLVASSISLFLLLVGIFQGVPSSMTGSSRSHPQSTLRSCLCATPAISNPCVSIPATPDWKEESLCFHQYHSFFLTLMIFLSSAFVCWMFIKKIIFVCLLQEERSSLHTWDDICLISWCGSWSQRVKMLILPLEMNITGK